MRLWKKNRRIASCAGSVIGVSIKDNADGVGSVGGVRNVGCTGSVDDMHNGVGVCIVSDATWACLACSLKLNHNLWLLRLRQAGRGLGEGWERVVRRWKRVGTEWETGGIGLGGGLGEGWGKHKQAHHQSMVFSYTTHGHYSHHGLGYVSVCGLYLVSPRQMVSGTSRVGMYREKIDTEKVYPSRYGYKIK